jgi:hypothetical protein
LFLEGLVMNTNKGIETGVARRRFGGSLDSIAEGLMALLLSVVAVGAFVHEWRPAAGAPVDSIARYHTVSHSRRG